MYFVVGSKLDLLQYLDGVEPEQLECELRRYSTEGIYVRWPGAQGYNHWFSCTLKHRKGLFMVTGFLRHPSDQHPPGQQDYRSWPAISDTEILTTTGKFHKSIYSQLSSFNFVPVVKKHYKMLVL